MFPPWQQQQQQNVPPLPPHLLINNPNNHHQNQMFINQLSGLIQIPPQMQQQNQQQPPPPPHTLVQQIPSLFQIQTQFHQIRPLMSAQPTVHLIQQQQQQQQQPLPLFANNNNNSQFIQRANQQPQIIQQPHFQPQPLPPPLLGNNQIQRPNQQQSPHQQTHHQQQSSHQNNKKQFNNRQTNTFKAKNNCPKIFRFDKLTKPSEIFDDTNYKIVPVRYLHNLNKSPSAPINIQTIEYSHGNNVQNQNLNAEPPSLLSLKLPTPNQTSSPPPPATHQQQSQQQNYAKFQQQQHFPTNQAPLFPIVNEPSQKHPSQLQQLRQGPPPPCQAPLFPILNELSQQQQQQPKIQQKHKIIPIDDILRKPGRLTRPPKIVIIFRGPPGSGKSYISNLIKLEEEKNDASKPKILSIDNYFMIEREKECKNGSITSKKIVMEYEYDKSMDENYQRSLVKTFKKTIDDGLFDFVIVDMVNEKMSHVDDMYNYAKSKGFQAFIIEIMSDVVNCTNKNVHNRSFKEIYDVIQSWEALPYTYVKLDIRSLLQDDAIENVEMDDVCEVKEDEKIAEDIANCDESDSENDESSFNDVPSASKWETFDRSEDKLNQLDGINSASSKRNRNCIDNSSTLTLQDYLEINKREKKKKSTKRVKWKDFEEEEKIFKQKELGFIVGQTEEDWRKMTGDYKPNEENSLKSYKYI